MSALLELREVTVDLPVAGEPRRVLDGVSLDLAAGEALALVGESGSGKSMTIRAIVRLLPPGARAGGEVRFAGALVGRLGRAELARFRADDVGLVYQDPRPHLNPVRTIGDFLTEGLRTTHRVGERAARARAVALLEDVLVDDPERRLLQYPHELSGGLLQRVVIAAALATEPRLLLADEPTTALDVTTQAEVMAILDEQRRERGLALLFVTHDLDLAAAVCDRASVMYAGAIVESTTAAALQQAPRHPYTAALLAARPSIERAGRRAAIPGRPLSCFEAPPGCAFADRCGWVEQACRDERPALVERGGAWTRCRRSDELGALRPEPAAAPQAT